MLIIFSFLKVLTQYKFQITLYKSNKKSSQLFSLLYVIILELCATKLRCDSYQDANNYCTNYKLAGVTEDFLTLWVPTWHIDDLVYNIFACNTGISVLWNYAVLIKRNQFCL